MNIFIPFPGTFRKSVIILKSTFSYSFHPNGKPIAQLLFNIYLRTEFQYSYELCDWQFQYSTSITSNIHQYRRILSYQTDLLEIDIKIIWYITLLSILLKLNFDAALFHRHFTVEFKLLFRFLFIYRCSVL